VFFGRDTTLPCRANITIHPPSIHSLSCTHSRRESSARALSLQVWRLFTCFFFWGRLSFQFLINMMLLYRHSSSLETSIYDGRKADYVFFLLFSAAFLLLSTVLLKSAIVAGGLLSSIVYLWSRKNPELEMSFMFGLRFKAIYLPWVLCGFKMLQGGMPIEELTGIVVGHLWYFITDLYPLQSGRVLLKTPQFLYNFFPSPYAPRADGNNDAPRARHAWGAGHRLQ
jgi:hypothetical protein